MRLYFPCHAFLCSLFSTDLDQKDFTDDFRGKPDWFIAYIIYDVQFCFSVGCMLSRHNWWVPHHVFICIKRGTSWDSHIWFSSSVIDLSIFWILSSTITVSYCCSVCQTYPWATSILVQLAFTLSYFLSPSTGLDQSSLQWLVLWWMNMF